MYSGASSARSPCDPWSDPLAVGGSPMELVGLAEAGVWRTDGHDRQRI